MKNLIEIFKQALDKRGFKSKSAPKFKIKPSDLGSPCLRKIFYASGGVERDFDFDIDGKIRMAFGDGYHDVLTQVFKESGTLVEYVNPDGSVHKKFGFAEETIEFPIDFEELFIKNAYVDGVFIIDGEAWVGEYKSIGSKGFKDLVEPKKDHMIQTITYWYILNLKLQEGKFAHIEKLKGITSIKGARWLYVNKDTHEFKEYHMTNADKFFAEIVNKIVTVRHNYETNTLPPKTPDFCKSCNWRNKCAKNFKPDRN